MPIFIKYDQLEGEAEHVKHRTDQLADGFEDLGDGFVKIVFDAERELTASDSTDLKIKSRFDHAALVFGDDFFKVGTNFLTLQDSVHKFDDAFVKLADPFIKITPSDNGDVAPVSLASDFKFWEGDLKTTGLDIWASATTWKLDVKFDNTGSLGLAFQTLSDDFFKLGNDEHKIGADFRKVSTQTDHKVLGAAFLKYGDDTVKLGDEYIKLSADFQKLAQDFAPAAPSDASFVKLTPTIDQVIQQNPQDFLKVAFDWNKLDRDLVGIGGDTVKLAEAVETAGTQTHFKLS